MHECSRISRSRCPCPQGVLALFLCASVCVQVGLDQFIAKTATLTNESEKEAHGMKAMKFRYAYVRVHVGVCVF